MTRHILMCEPVHYRIAYEINPWMRRTNTVTHPRALEQWRRLREAVQQLGVTVEQIEQGEEVPDMTFTANAGVVVGRRFIPANFLHIERQPEERRFIDWFEARGYECADIHSPHYWEGEGDVLPTDDGRVFAGWRFRTEYRALDHLDEHLGRPTTRLELSDERFYHLDTCLCPLGNGRAMYYPPAFTPEARATLADAFPTLLAVDHADALRFACNALVVEAPVVTPPTDAEPADSRNVSDDRANEAASSANPRPDGAPASKASAPASEARATASENRATASDARATGSDARATDNAVVMNTGCPTTVEALRALGLHPVQTPTDEFIKAGGSVKCLTLTLDSFTEAIA